MDPNRLRQSVERQIDRTRRAERSRTSLIARTAYLGSVGIMLVLPIVAGAYLGRWLDEHAGGVFSFSWTVSLIVVGIAVGAFSVVNFVRQTWD